MGTFGRNGDSPVPPDVPPITRIGGLEHFDIGDVTELHEAAAELTRAQREVRIARWRLQNQLSLGPWKASPGPWMTSTEVADAFGIPVRLVRELASHGPIPVGRRGDQLTIFGLPAIRYGWRLLYPRREIEALVGRPPRSQ